MTSRQLKQFVVEGLQEYFEEKTRHDRTPIKENTMKKSELKGLVKEVVRQCIMEATTKGNTNVGGGPQYKVNHGEERLERPGLRMRARNNQNDTKQLEECGMEGQQFQTNVAAPSKEDVWALHNRNLEEAMKSAKALFSHNDEDEAEEIRLIKGLGLIVIKLLKMHRSMPQPTGPEAVSPDVEAGGEAPEGGEEMGGEEPAPEGGEEASAFGGGEEEPPFKGPEAEEEPSAEEPGPEPSPAPEPEAEPEPAAEEEPAAEKPKAKKKDKSVDENHKVQVKSYSTVLDAPNDPNNIRDPECPE